MIGVIVCLMEESLASRRRTYVEAATNGPGRRQVGALGQPGPQRVGTCSERIKEKRAKWHEKADRRSERAGERYAMRIAIQDEKSSEHREHLRAMYLAEAKPHALVVEGENPSTSRMVKRARGRASAARRKAGREHRVGVANYQLHGKTWVLSSFLAGEYMEWADLLPLRTPTRLRLIDVWPSDPLREVRQIDILTYGEWASMHPIQAWIFRG